MRPLFGSQIPSTSSTDINCQAIRRRLIRRTKSDLDEARQFREGRLFSSRAEYRIQLGLCHRLLVSCSMYFTQLGAGTGTWTPVREAVDYGKTMRCGLAADVAKAMHHALL